MANCCGPVDNTTVTNESGSSWVPAAGSVVITKPAGTESEISLRSRTLKSSSWSVSNASGRDLFERSGTAMSVVSVSGVLSTFPSSTTPTTSAASRPMMAMM